MKSFKNILSSIFRARGAAADECRLHHTRMTAENIPVLYGKPVISNEYSVAREEQFPHARERCVFGGCELGERGSAKVPVCSSCSKARERWIKEHYVRDARL